MNHVALQLMLRYALRAKFMAEISIYDPAVSVWVDESRCAIRNTTGIALEVSYCVTSTFLSEGPIIQPYWLFPWQECMISTWHKEV